MSPRGRTCLVSRLPELPPCLPTRQPGAPRVTRSGWWTHGLPPVEAGRRTDARSLRSAAKPRRPAGSGRRERQPGRRDPAVRGPGPAPVLAAITLVGRCQRRAAVDAVPASGVVGGVHEGPVGPRRSPATLDAEHSGGLLGGHRRCSQPGGGDCAGSVWPPNSRWARIRNHWNALGPEPRARRATDHNSPWENLCVL